MTTRIEIEARGVVPRPQGSKRAFKLPNGKITMVEASKDLKPWRSYVRECAEKAFHGLDLLDGALQMKSTFFFCRPKTHYGAGKNEAIVKPSAPLYPTGVPDLSKLLRGIEDALEGTVYTNDSRIVQHLAKKAYVGRLTRPGVYIMVSEL